MSDPIAQLCQLIAEKLREEPEASQEALVMHVEAAIAKNAKLATALEVDQQVWQINQNRSTGYLITVKGSGTANIGNHYHIPVEKFEDVLRGVLPVEKFEDVLRDVLPAVLSKLQISDATKVDFQPYLQTIVKTYGKWWELYTLTEAVQQAKDNMPVDCELMVQTVTEQKDAGASKQEQRERLPVLEGILKYAKSHVVSSHAKLITNSFPNPVSTFSTCFFRVRQFS